VNLNDHAKQGKAVFVAKVTINKGSTPGAGNSSQSSQPPRSTQPGHPSVDRHIEYRPKGGDAL